MNKSFSLFLLFCMALCFYGSDVNAQTDTLHKQLKDSTTAKTDVPATTADDDDFNAGLLVIGAAMVCCMVGAAIVGSFAAALTLLLAALFISTGVLSVSLLAAFYKKSIAAGFKTFILIICMIGGGAIGSTGLFIVTKVFTLHLSGRAAFLFGGVGGLVGGVLMGLVIHKLIVYLTGYIKRKLQIL